MQDLAIKYMAKGLAKPFAASCEDSWISKKLARCMQRVKRAKARQVETVFMSMPGNYML